ncbi:MAG: AI-2E family transporter, partial [Gemmatimonadota bacterium]
AAFFSIFVDRLESAMPRWLATLLVLLVVLAATAAFWFLAWPQLQGQAGRLASEVPRVIADVAEWAREQYRTLVPAGPQARQEAETTMRQRLQGEAMDMVAGALPLLNTAVGTFTGALVTLFAAVFLVLDPEGYLERGLRLVPPDGRARIRDALRETGATLKRWIAGMSVSMVVIFAATSLGLWALGVPAALVLGLIAGFLVFIPFIGPALSAIPALAMALTVSPIMMAWVALLYFAVQLLESNLLTPMVMREAVDLQPAATLLFQMGMGVLFGFLGLLLAEPMFAAIQVLVKRLYVDRLEHA